MKLRNPTLIKAAGLAGAWLLRAWVGSLRYRYCPLGPNLNPCSRSVRGRYIYAFWHENLLLPAYHYGGHNFHVLISQHADGQLMTEMIHRLGFKAIRGSTTRGGIEAVRRLLGLGSDVHLGITPDGPRGPRRHVQMGLIWLSARLGMPIVPAGFAYHRPWRMKSWDRFALPRPGSRATCVTGEPIVVAQHTERDLLEEYRTYTEQRLLEATAAAEGWAETGVPPIRPAAAVPPGERKLAG